MFAVQFVFSLFRCEIKNPHESCAAREILDGSHSDRHLCFIYNNLRKSENFRMETVTPGHTIRRATMDDHDAFLNVMVDAYTNTEPIAKALNVSKEDAGEFVKGE